MKNRVVIVYISALVLLFSIGIISLALTISPQNFNKNALFLSETEPAPIMETYKNCDNSTSEQVLIAFTDNFDQTISEGNVFKEIEQLFGGMHEIEESVKKDINAELLRNAKKTGIFLD